MAKNNATFDISRSFAVSGHFSRTRVLGRQGRLPLRVRLQGRRGLVRQEGAKDQPLQLDLLVPHSGLSCPFALVDSDQINSVSLVLNFTPMLYLFIVLYGRFQNVTLHVSGYREVANSPLIPNDRYQS